MRTLRLALAFVTILAAPLSAQRAIAYEGGVLVQYTKFDDFTKLKSAVGLGGHFDVYILRRLALEYEGDFGSTTSSRLGKLTALNNRIDLVYNQPLNDTWRFLIGGGFTGTQYKSDTTKNQYDSGGNAVLGFRYCVNDNWSWKGEGVADFKDPSDQTVILPVPSCGASIWRGALRLRSARRGCSPSAAPGARTARSRSPHSRAR